MTLTTNVRLTDEAEAALRAIAAREGRSLNDVINRSLVAANRQTSRAAYVGELFDRAEARWATVLDQLARA